MGKIFYLMGKSSSGKDTIYSRIMEEDSYLKTVVLYTTRPIRSGETDGETYHFTDEDRLAEFEQQGKLIEIREYDTVHGVWKYFTVNDGQFDLKYNDYLMIGTLVSFKKMKEYFGDETVCPIYVEVDDGIRLQRALDRERSQDHPKYAEMCRRFLADTEDFSEEKIKKAGIHQRFSNADFDNCVKNIRDYIKSHTISFS